MSLHDISRSLQPAPVPTKNPWNNINELKKNNNNHEIPTTHITFARGAQKAGENKALNVLHDKGNYINKSNSKKDNFKENDNVKILARKRSSNAEDIDKSLREATNTFQNLQLNTGVKQGRYHKKWNHSNPHCGNGNNSNSNNINNKGSNQKGNNNNNTNTPINSDNVVNEIYQESNDGSLSCKSEYSVSQQVSPIQSPSNTYGQFYPIHEHQFANISTMGLPLPSYAIENSRCFNPYPNPVGQMAYFPQPYQQPYYNTHPINLDPQSINKYHESGTPKSGNTALSSSSVAIPNSAKQIHPISRSSTQSFQLQQQPQLQPQSQLYHFHSQSQQIPQNMIPIVVNGPQGSNIPSGPGERYGLPMMIPINPMNNYTPQMPIMIPMMNNNSMYAQTSPIVTTPNICNSNSDKLEDERYNKLNKQIKYYFSVENLCKDMYLRKQMDDKGFIGSDIIKGFSRVQNITCGDDELFDLVVDAIEGLETDKKDNGGKGNAIYKIRLREGWDKWVLKKNILKEKDSPRRNV